MFTGIIEATGTVMDSVDEGTNVHFHIQCPFLSELRIDQSVAHNGVCLTVVDIMPSHYRVTAIRETLDRSDLRQWSAGTRVNLERCMTVNGRLDGHLVQGHVDQRAVLQHVENVQGSWNFKFNLGTPHGGLIVNKGSICVNGVSLTVVEAGETGFSVSVIPYTFEHTTFSELRPGAEVNLEFDIIGKYVQAMLKARS
jgi:riboflavin synthase